MLNPKPTLLWRDPMLPMVEAKQAHNSEACYDKHSHASLSFGVVYHGQARYFNQNQNHAISAGCFVLMNPHAIHACNPIDQSQWSYRMLFVDTHWLDQAGFGHNNDARTWQNYFSQCLSTDIALYQAFNLLFKCFLHSNSILEKEESLSLFIALIFQKLEKKTLSSLDNANHNSQHIIRAADYISEHCTQKLSLKEISDIAHLSHFHFIRAFKQYFHLTPHAFLLNKRIQYAQTLLKQGHSIAESALISGFADQAHFSRVFKKQVALTPAQYQTY